MRRAHASTFRDNQRVLFAMQFAPARRRMLIARFLSVAMTRGPLPLRTWLRSSSKVTSRTQWSEFSIRQ